MTISEQPGDTAAMAGAPFRVLERSVYRGPHLYSRRPMIRIRVDLGTLEQWPSDRLPGFAERLTQLLPGLVRHGCSYRQPGGFLRRLEQGTWIGHIIEHVALELQVMAGSMVTRGKTRSVAGQPGVYDILYTYRDEEASLHAGACAIALVLSLLPEELQALENAGRLGVPIPDHPQNIAAVTESIAAILRRNALGPTTSAIVAAAERRGIPVLRLNRQSLLQLGYGSRQKRVRASITSDSSQIAVGIAGNKDLAKQLLAEVGLPVPRGVVVRDRNAALVEARRLGWPVVVKPLDGNHGRGVTTGIGDAAALATAFERATAHGRQIIVEQQLPGHDHRILVIAGKVVAVAERLPAQIVGDGQNSIRALIDIVNSDPRRGVGHENMLTRIVLDASMRDLLAKTGRSADSVPAAGDVVRLRDTANLSTGGTAVDRTDDIHPYNRLVAEQAAATVGLDVCGIDFLTPDISQPISTTGGGIVEVNAAPGFRMHLEPSEGKARDVAIPLVEALFPRGSRARIPIFAITGTNGKSTTVRMVGHILRHHGLNVGMATTSGLYFNGQLLKKADASGPRSARAVLRNPGADAAVLETARGGILREGLGFDRADIGAVLNVSADHLGLKGIDTVERLADVKAVVIASVARRGHAVLNADDPLCRRMARHARGRLIWFSLQGGEVIQDIVKAHIRDGGIAVVREPGEAGGTLVLHRGGVRTLIMQAGEIPATLGGVADFNIANALAAAAMCAAHGVDMRVIADALRSFTTSFEDSPGRLNLHEADGRRFLVDYAHNPASLTALGQAVKQMRGPTGRVIGMVSIPGDRRDADMIEMGKVAAGIFDEIIFREAPDGRGRPVGQTSGLMWRGALDAGMGEEYLHRILDEVGAAKAALAMSRPGDMVVLLPTAVEQIWRLVLDYHADEPSLAERHEDHAHA